MQTNKRISQDKIDFIHKHKDLIRQADMARLLEVCPSTVNQIIKGKRRFKEDNEYFNIDQFASYYRY